MTLIKVHYVLNSVFLRTSVLWNLLLMTRERFTNFKSHAFSTSIHRSHILLSFVVNFFGIRQSIYRLDFIELYYHGAINWLQ